MELKMHLGFYIVISEAFSVYTIRDVDTEVRPSRPVC